MIDSRPQSFTQFHGSTWHPTEDAPTFGANFGDHRDSPVSLEAGSANELVSPPPHIQSWSVAPPKHGPDTVSDSTRQCPKHTYRPAPPASCAWPPAVPAQSPPSPRRRCSPRSRCGRGRLRDVCKAKKKDVADVGCWGLRFQFQFQGHRQVSVFQRCRASETGIVSVGLEDNHVE